MLLKKLRISPRQHLSFLVQGLMVWLGFWLLGLPKYYQQYSQVGLGVGCTLLSVAISLWAVVILQRGRSETRLGRAFWISFYFTVPFAVLDTLYCAWFLGNGWEYLGKYWYLTVFYCTPWLTFIPTALVFQDEKRAET